MRPDTQAGAKPPAQRGLGPHEPLLQRRGEDQGADHDHPRHRPGNACRINGL